MSGVVLNVDRCIRRINDIPLQARDGIGKALAMSVVEMDALAKQSIQGGKRSGRTYTRRSVRHQASAPGEYPKTDTGQLVASLFFRVAADKLSALFGTKLAYGRWLEYGTSRMLPRPWLRPTFKALKDRISARVAVAVGEAIRKATLRG